MVEPFAFFVIELSAGFGHTVKREVLDQFVHSVHLLITGTMPTQQGEEVNNRLGQIAALAITGRDSAIFLVVELQREDRETESVTVTFGEFAVSVGFEQQRQMGELGHRILPSECTIEQHMERGRRQPFLTADDVRDLH